MLARLLREAHLRHERVGALSLVSAGINDIVACRLLAMVIAVVHAAGLAGLLRMLGL